MTEARRPSRLNVDSRNGGRSFPVNILPVSLIPTERRAVTPRFTALAASAPCGGVKVGTPSAKILGTPWNHFREKEPGGPELTRKTGNTLTARDGAASDWPAVVGATSKSIVKHQRQIRQDGFGV